MKVVHNSQDLRTCSFSPRFLVSHIHNIQQQLMVPPRAFTLCAFFLKLPSTLRVVVYTFKNGFDSLPRDFVVWVQRTIQGSRNSWLID